MSDDMVVTGGTLLAGARALKAAGATAVYACATHGLFPDGTLNRLAESEIEQIVVTDTVPIDPLRRPAKLQVLTVSRILAESIRNVFSDESVSAIFAGENQLF
jgi:ribose-phosphate pyrophosphokinase